MVLLRRHEGIVIVFVGATEMEQIGLLVAGSRRPRPHQHCVALTPILVTLVCVFSERVLVFGNCHIMLQDLAVRRTSLVVEEVSVRQALLQVLVQSKERATVGLTPVELVVGEVADVATISLVVLAVFWCHREDRGGLVVGGFAVALVQVNRLVVNLLVEVVREHFIGVSVQERWAVGVFIGLRSCRWDYRRLHSLVQHIVPVD